MLGAILLVLAVVLFAAGTGTETSGPPSTAATGLQPTTSSTEPAPPAPTTTRTSPSTTTLQATPSTGGGGEVDAAASVSALIDTLAATIEAGDSEAVLALLHPAITSGFGEDLCRSWVEDEIMALEGYRAVGDVTGPTSGSLDTPSGPVEFGERYSVPIAFTFQGQEFEATADFVVEDGTAYFTGTCE